MRSICITKYLYRVDEMEKEIKPKKDLLNMNFLTLNKHQ